MTNGKGGGGGGGGVTGHALLRWLEEGKLQAAKSK